MEDIDRLDDRLTRQIEELEEKFSHKIELLERDNEALQLTLLYGLDDTDAQHIHSELDEWERPKWKSKRDKAEDRLMWFNTYLRTPFRFEHLTVPEVLVKGPLAHVVGELRLRGLKPTDDVEDVFLNEAVLWWEPARAANLIRSFHHFHLNWGDFRGT